MCKDCEECVHLSAGRGCCSGMHGTPCVSDYNRCPNLSRKWRKIRLKPCPFCGASPVLIDNSPNGAALIEHHENCYFLHRRENGGFIPVPNLKPETISSAMSRKRTFTDFEGWNNRSYWEGEQE